MNILVAHSDDKARSALCLFVAQNPCFKVTGAAENDQELMHLVSSCQPDLVLLDWLLPGSPAAELVSALRAAKDGLKVIVLVSRPELHAEVQRAGVHGWINLWEPPQKVLTTILALICEDSCNPCANNARYLCDRQPKDHEPDTI